MASPITAANAYASLRLADRAPIRSKPERRFGGPSFGKMVTDAMARWSSQAASRRLGRHGAARPISSIGDGGERNGVAVEAMVSVRDKVIPAYEDIMRMPIYDPLSGAAQHEMMRCRPGRSSLCGPGSASRRFALRRVRTQGAKMTGPEVLDVARDAIITLVLVSAPLMLVGLVVGVVISLFQALTQIQEMTLCSSRRFSRSSSRCWSAAVHGRRAARNMTRSRHASWAIVQRRAHAARRLIPARLRRRFILMFARIGT